MALVRVSTSFERRRDPTLLDVSFLLSLSLSLISREFHTRVHRLATKGYAERRGLFKREARESY